MIYYQDLQDKIKEAKTIGVISHINPDADNLGSLTALSESLRQLGKDVDSICIDPVPSNLLFLHGIDKLTKDYRRDYDLVFILDSSDEDRLGYAKDILEMTEVSVAIDHHISNNMPATYKYLDVEASSTGEILYQFMQLYGLRIDKNIGESIFTAIVGDSGSFRYDTVSKKTFEIAAELMDYHIDKLKVDINLYGNNPLSKIKMLKRALDRMVVDIDSKLATTYILIQDYIDLEADPGDIEGIVEKLRDIEGVEVALLFKETKENVKVSSRSKSYFDVSKFAQRFSGGGHVKAAGFSIDTLDVQEAIDLVVGEYERLTTS